MGTRHLAAMSVQRQRAPGVWPAIIIGMGLDAFVCCNCYETGNVKTPPPQPDLVYVDPTSGEILLRWEEKGADQNRFLEWLSSACEHGPFSRLVSHRLGNIARIGFLRRRFEETPERFPTLLSKVVYNGVHGGNVLTLPDVERVAAEMSAVHALSCSDDFDEEMLREFERQMLELIRGARSVSKPIVF